MMASSMKCLLEDEFEQCLLEELTISDQRRCDDDDSSGTDDLTVVEVRGWIQNFQDWCRHLYSSCVSAKHRKMVGQPCLASLLAKFHVGRMT